MPLEATSLCRVTCETFNVCPCPHFPFQRNVARGPRQRSARKHLNIAKNHTEAVRPAVDRRAEPMRRVVERQLQWNPKIRLQCALLGLFLVYLYLIIVILSFNTEFPGNLAGFPTFSNVFTLS